MIRLIATALLLSLAACSQLRDARRPIPDKDTPRSQLSAGYSLIYQEADGIPKLKWIFMIEEKPQEMGRLANDVVAYFVPLVGRSGVEFEREVLLSCSSAIAK